MTDAPSYRADQGIDPHPGWSWRAELGLGVVRIVVVPDHVAADQLHYGGMAHETLTAAMMGDPLPGRRALDLVPAPAIVPAAVPKTGVGKVKRILSARQKRRRKAMAALAKDTPNG